VRSAGVWGRHLACLLLPAPLRTDVSRLSPAERQAGCLPHISGGTPGGSGHWASVRSAVVWGRHLACLFLPAPCARMCAGCRQPNGRQDACPTSAAAHPGLRGTQRPCGRRWCGAGILPASCFPHPAYGREPAVAGRRAGRMPAPHQRRHTRGFGDTQRQVRSAVVWDRHLACLPPRTLRTDVSRLSPAERQARCLPHGSGGSRVQPWASTRRGSNGARSRQALAPSSINSTSARPVGGAMRMPWRPCPVAT